MMDHIIICRRHFLPISPVTPTAVTVLQKVPQALHKSEAHFFREVSFWRGVSRMYFVDVVACRWYQETAR